MRILIATDAWRPQINGVVRTYEHIAAQMPALGHELVFLTPECHRSVPCPTYPEIRLAFVTPRHVRQRVEELEPDFIHIATEGPIGLAARSYCLSAGRSFTTSYHTRFPEYVAARFPIRVSWAYSYMRWFHNAGAGVMVATNSLAEELRQRGFSKIYPWSRGVDTELFKPNGARLFGCNEPVFMYVGRVAVEKNIEAFLDLELPGKRVVVGGGPQLESLRNAYPDVIFTGPKSNGELADHFASADVFVFPSLTDTYGVVLLEAMAAGVPVAAYPVTGPRDVIVNGEVGVLDKDLRHAALQALKLNRERCREYALKFSWKKSAEQFIDNIRAAAPRAGSAISDARQKNSPAVDRA